MSNEIEERLVVGCKIRIGKQYAQYADEHGFKEGEVITLVEGFFEFDNGLYTETQIAPSVYDEALKDFDSIYHLFGNNMEHFLDNEIIE